MQPRFVDLHTHTTASDGTDTPADLVRKAAALHLAAVAITDHDTLSGLDEAVEAGRASDIEVIRGCELSADGPYGEVHLLGLWIPEKAGLLEQAFAHLREQRVVRNHLMLERLAALGMPVSYDDVLAQAKGETVGRPHIAQAMRTRGYVQTVGEAFAKYISAQGTAYVPRVLPSVTEGIQLLVQSGALVSFAHPMLIRCPDGWLESVLPSMKEAGLSAIEAYHTEHSARDERTCVALAARYGLGLSGGSDYHGANKPGVALGRGKGGLRVTTGFLETLARRRSA